MRPFSHDGQRDVWAAVTAAPEEESLSYLLRGRDHPLITPEELARILAAWPDTPAVPFAQNDLDVIAENLQVPFWGLPGYDGERRYEIAIELAAWIRGLRPSRFPPEEADGPDPAPTAAAPEAPATAAEEATEQAAKKELFAMAQPVLHIRATMSNTSRVVCQRMVVAANLGEVYNVICLVEGEIAANIGDVVVHAPVEARITSYASLGTCRIERCSYAELLRMAQKFRR